MDKETYLNDIELTAKVLLQLTIDLDYTDYIENTNEILADLENVLQDLKAICQNEYNRDCFRTFARCLDVITETTELNESLFTGGNE